MDNTVTVPDMPEILIDAILNFILIHVASIHYLSDAGITLARKPFLEGSRQDCFNMALPSILFDKALLTRKGLIGKPQGAKPCLHTTCLSIRLLSSLSCHLKKSNKNPSLKKKASYIEIPESLSEELKLASTVQLLYCMEQISTKGNPSILDLMDITDACMHYATRFGDYENECPLVPELYSHINEMLSRIVSEFEPSEACSRHCIRFIKTMVLQNEYHGAGERDERLTGAVLEFLNRRTKSGLFAEDALFGVPLPMAMQFEAMASLLSAYRYIRLDGVLEDVFGVFNMLYKTAYKEAVGCFTFTGSKSVPYNASEIAAIINCLRALHSWSPQGSDQQQLLRSLLHNYIKYIVQGFHQHFKRDIRRMTGARHPIYMIAREWEGYSEDWGGPIFPKRIVLSYPGPVVDWSRRGIVRLAQPLALCLSLMNIITDYEAEMSAEESGKLDLAALSANMPDGADLLLNILLRLIYES